MQQNRGFTLIELLVSLAILVILAGLLFPVFKAATESAKKTVCISNFKQVHAAVAMYSADYDDFFIPSEQNPPPSLLSPPGNESRTWVQLALIYLRTYPVFLCPSDYGRTEQDSKITGEDLVLGDTEAKYYRISKRSNIGYNYLHFSPIYKNVAGDWVTAPRNSSRAENMHVLMFLDSVYDMVRQPVGEEQRKQGEKGEPTDQPTGGGSHLVLAPCRYTAGVATDTFRLPGVHNSDIYKTSLGWSNELDARTSIFGNVFPWHLAKRVTTISLMGSARAQTISQIVAGNRVRSDWVGDVADEEKNQWALSKVR